MQAVLRENILFDLIVGGKGVFIIESKEPSSKKPKKPKKDNLIKRIINKIFKKNKNKDLGDKLKELEDEISIKPVEQNSELEV